tara:strand:- start:43 stop:624 length:582 start_codon:yes stop_codon:yes gene_type:complete
MGRYRRIKQKPNQSNAVKGLMGFKSNDKVINTLSSGIMIICNKYITRNGRTIFSEIPSTDIVKKLCETLPTYEKRKKLLKGYFQQKEEFKILIYTELYKLVNLGYLKSRKYRKYTFYQLTEKGIKYRYKYTELDLAEYMIDYFERRGCKIRMVQAKGYTSRLIKRALAKAGIVETRDYAQNMLIQKRKKEDIN